VSPTRLTILGSTGSIGRSALDVVRHHPERFEVVALAGHANVDLLARQVAEFRPRRVALSDPAAAARLESRVPGTEVLGGPEGLDEVASAAVDVTLCAVVGAAGLPPLLRAIDAGNRIALANKESLVMAGPLVLERAQALGVSLLPVDSEHNAIFQCLHGHDPAQVRAIHLTASGGPFYGKPRAALARVTPEEAANHPTWSMGAKISVDSATLMNKGLEVIEAMWLFNVPLSKIQVVIHPQSIVHGLVEFTDGTILAHLGVTDMRLPIQFALTWPERVQSPVERLDLTAIQGLTFDAPDFDAFPCLRIALDAARAGGTAPAILNAANEVAVEAFRNHRIGFLQIAEVIEEALARVAPSRGLTLEAVQAADAEARQVARAIATDLPSP